MNVTTARAGSMRPGSAAPPRPLLPALPAGAALSALLVLYPLWWILGLGTIIFPALALPMALRLLRRRPVQVPPYFGLWLLFLFWFVASTSMLGLNPPGAYGTDGGAARMVVIGLRLVEYISATIVLLYIGNHAEAELPRARIVKMLGVFCLVTIGGGLLGALWPGFEVTSPVELVLPSSISENLWVQSMIHPHAAQVQEVLGYTSPRPAAPFGYTNDWGQNLSLLLAWFAVGWLVYGTVLRRVAAGAALCLAIIPIVYSLNRGLWIGLALAVLYVTFRVAARGRVWILGVLGVLLSATVMAFLLSPLAGVAERRLAHPHSNDTRTFTAIRTLQAATHSPVLGYGNTRDARGSARSITVGTSPACQRCGTTLGSNGHFWLILMSQGYVGAALYVAFFALSLLRHARDGTPIGIAGTLVLLLGMLYMFVYNVLVAPLTIYMVSLALLWRNERELRGETQQRRRVGWQPS